MSTTDLDQMTRYELRELIDNRIAVDHAPMLVAQHLAEWALDALEFRADEEGRKHLARLAGDLRRRASRIWDDEVEAKEE